MGSSSSASPSTRFLMSIAALAVAGVLVAATLAAPEIGAGPESARSGSPPQEVSRERILRGRELVVQRACGTCHGGMDDPTAEGWLAGTMSAAQEFPIGACAEQPGAEPCWITRPRNLTPDNTTGTGRFSERQIFNALRYGLRPGETADVEITSSTPGEGNFPLSPKYLAPPMPWPAFRHMPDEDLWAIATYLKHGVKPVTNQVKDSDGPPDFWESIYADMGHGPNPSAPFPQAAEVEPGAGADRAQVLRGRELVITIGCGDCHGGMTNPASDGFLAGPNAPGQIFPVGPCLVDPNGPCFFQRPRNLTPDPETGLGNRTERQIYNALRYGLRPATSPDVDIADADFPANPDFLGPGMPWIHWRHMPDDQLRAIAAYLKHGLRPVHNPVPDSDKPAEGWPGGYTPGLIGHYPAPPFPTAREVGG